MKIHEKLVKPIHEAKYLDVENTDRYRSIARLFYINYEKLKYWMYQEEVYDELIQDAYFAGYTMEQCQQDLDTLTRWGNLATIQDTRHVSSIEEFKNKKFRYQLTETTVEIERMVVRLENLFIEGASLEPTLLERLRYSLSRLEEVSEMSTEKICSWWNDLNNDFVRLNQNYQDYMRELNSVKAEEMMKTREFLVFKDRLIEYLRSFVKSLQINVSAIEQSLRMVRPEIIQILLEQVTAYEMSIPRIDTEVDEQQIFERMQGRWENIRKWFVGANGAESESMKVFDTTNEVIRKITRYANRLSEQSNNGANRKEEYHKLASMFAKCKDINEAHKLSAVVFGIEKPLHKVVDFTEHIEEKQASCLEEALFSMGILDALIVPAEYREAVRNLDKGVCDRYIFGDVTKIKKNLLEWMDVDNGENDILRYQSVSAILSAIGIGGMEPQEEIGSTWIDKNGNYKTGIVEGTITGEYTACYIGVRARERFRTEKIAQLEKQVMELQAGLTECKAKVQEYAENIRLLEEEWNAFPAGTDMQTVARELWEKNNESEQIHKELERLRTQLQSVKTELDQIELRVREICSKCYLTARLDVFVNTLQALGRYQGLLTEIQVKHGKYRSGISTLHSLADTLSALDEDLDTIRYELGRVNSKVRALESELKSIEEQLALTDYEKIKERLDYCLERLPKIPKERERSMGLQTKWQEEAKRLGADILQQEEQQQKNRNRYQWLEKGFREEYRLGYVERFFVVNEDMEEQADKVCAMLSERLGTKKKAELHERLQGAFHENKGYLLHYQLTMQTMFADEEEEELNPAVSMRRTDIVAKYRGMNVKFKELVGKLREDAEEQKHLLSDKERELFEDILANTISKKIRAKIHASNRWVEKMNQLMGSMQTSSGLKLSLRWKHKRAEKEGQLDTRELVELLSKDSEIMRVEELDKLSVHFRTKIEEARKLSEDGNSVQSFHAIMREVLDYRKWFEFTLECEKTGEKKREMTDRVFFTFSGGEKAMSMYVPLFSAVVAKYAGARPDAPRLISLDEAFAGVDETNIRDMFRLMVECKFNFMINSQVLWGDYDTVPGLAIYQLLRPENAKYVTVIKYIWNGKEKLVVA